MNTSLVIVLYNGGKGTSPLFGSLGRDYKTGDVFSVYIQHCDTAPI